MLKAKKIRLDVSEQDAATLEMSAAHVSRPLQLVGDEAAGGRALELEARQEDVGPESEV